MVPSQLHISLHKSTAARPFSFCGSAFYIRERWRLSFDPPARRAVFRRQRQRDSSLWTPFHRLRAGRKAAATGGCRLIRLRGRRSFSDSAAVFTGFHL